MALTHEEIQQLKKEIFDEADEKYVRIEECNDKQEAVNKKFANDDKRIDLMATDIKQMRAENKSSFKFNNWLTTGVLIAIIGAVIAYYFLR